MNKSTIEAFALVKNGQMYDQVFTNEEAAESRAAMMEINGDTGWKVVRLVEEKAA